MILAVGLTPAWQQILVFPQFRVGAVNRAATADWCASGKVLNVGVALHQLGTTARTLSLLGGRAGAEIEAEFARLGISARWVSTAAPTRVCTTILDRATGQTTELVENSPAVSSAELEEFLDVFAAEARSAQLVVFSGSLPQGTPCDYYRRLLERTTAPALLDVRGPELQACLPLRPWLVKPNREELAATVGRPLTTDDDVRAAIAELREAGAQHVVVSDGPHQLWAGGPDGVAAFAPPRVDTVNPIGCGDCLAAGLALAGREGRSWEEIVRFGIAAAAENARHLLPARLDRAAVDRLCAHVVRRS